MPPGATVNELVSHHSRVSALCCNAGGLSIYSGGLDRFVLQWDDRPPASSLLENTEEEEEKKGAGPINPYTVDTWSSSSDEEEGAS